MFVEKEQVPFVKASLEKASEKLALVREKVKRPLTLSEKILFSHLADPENFDEKKQFLLLNPDRVLMQDVTAQMALLQFMLAGKKEVEAPTTIHCDHLIQARLGEKKDMEEAKVSNKEVFDFLSTVANKYGIGFWKPGAGIIHQVVLENYAFPGSLMIGTDSHTPNAGGLGVVAVGVGGADAVDVMAGFPWELKKPQIIGVHLKGSLKGWGTSKDVILKLLGILTVKGGTNKIIEYFGEGTKSLSATGKGTICNMGAELGATSSVFPYDEKMNLYLKSTSRKSIADLLPSFKKNLEADEEVLKNPEKHYDRVIEIDLSSLEPHISGPHSPDKVRPIKELKKELEREDWPPDFSAALIGSCTNSSYEDIGLACDVASQASKEGLKMPQPFLVTPGSELVKQTIKRDGFMEIFEKVGALVLANACGPCIGQWKRGIKKGETNSILSSFNRNFKGRNDANPNTLSFIGSPSLVMAMGLAGRLDFNPETDEIVRDGKKVKLTPPQADELPQKPFLIDKEGYQAPKGEKEDIKIDPQSQRLQRLTPFKAPKKEEFKDMVILCKAKGKCTTDHISPAGFWLKYRGHLDKISDNMLSGAVNSFSEETGRGKNLLTSKKAPFSEVAREYKKKGQPWMILGEENYGEGSSREHAAMTPRYLGAKVVLVKSFARIHETNLKKQGVLALTFVNPKDYDKFLEEDQVSFPDFDALAPKSEHKLILTHKDGKSEKIPVKHSFNLDQIKWFKAGSSLNTLK